MPINLTTYLSGKDVTPTEDAIVYEYATNGDGIIFGCDVSQKSDNKIFVASGHGIFHGRKFTVLEETIQVPLTSNASEKKKLIVHMDLANRSNPIEFLIQPASKDLIQQKNLNLINGIYELELATFTVTSTNVTNLKQTFTLLKRGKPTVTVDDVVGLDTEITKLEEADKKINGDVTRLKTDKADKSVAQMYKLTQDDGSFKFFTQSGGVNDIKGCQFGLSPYGGMPTQNNYSMMAIGMQNSTIGMHFAHHSTRGTYIKAFKDSKWHKLAYESNAQMHKLTQDNGTPTAIDKTKINDNLDTGLYYVAGVSINGNTYNGYLEVVKLSDNWAKQVFTTHMSGLVFNRVFNNKVWTPWQKLGGIDAKVYDIVMLGGLKPYKNAKELDNKIVVYNGVAHLDLNVDNKSVTGTSRITIPKELAVRVKPESGLYDERAYLTAITTMGHFEGEGEWGVKHFTPESTTPTIALYFNINGGMSSATTLKIEKSIWDNKGKAENRIAHVSWYVGGAK